ncbi:MAG TPA: chaperone modulator CbpM [Burkholderiaceae bacterium]|jgi:chaperone modulatory protein CbpM|nr:chaperone modulator CbpM [Burkholderiaceae bacterium]HRA78823.1 chaperone modulator CbpM [Burkholderiaceae bacterium]
MTGDDILTGDVLDEVMLTLDELARACAVEPHWVQVHVEAGLLGCTGGTTAEWRFASAELARARRMAALERDFEANEALAALVVDLIEEVRRLRARLQAAEPTWERTPPPGP